MKSKRIRKTLTTLLAVGIVAVTFGCGKAAVDLSFDKSETKPIIIYKSYQAIAPIYNPDVPVAIIYGDGTLIKKEGPYEFTSGRISGEGVAGVLKKISDEGFFDLEKDYGGGEPRVGGTTEALTVNLKEGTHTVRVQGGNEPDGWKSTVDAVTGVTVSGSRDYVPTSIKLFANAYEGTPNESDVEIWGEGDELEKAAAASGRGLELKGGEAEKAWRAIGEALKSESEVVWKEGDRCYTYVYASPVFTGVTDVR